LASYAAAATAFGPVLIDATGVGRVVLEEARARADGLGGTRLFGVTAHAGRAVRWHGENVSVPKSDLVQAAQAALEHNRLVIPDCHGGRLLARQLCAMRRDRRGRMEAKGGVHDDLAFALFMAAWAAERGEM
jgi:hypothetical protein